MAWERGGRSNTISHARMLYLIGWGGVVPVGAVGRKKIEKIYTN